MNSADADGVLSPTTTNRCYESLETIQPFSSEVGILKNSTCNKSLIQVYYWKFSFNVIFVNFHLQK